MYSAARRDSALQWPGHSTRAAPTSAAASSLYPCACSAAARSLLAVLDLRETGIGDGAVQELPALLAESRLQELGLSDNAFSRGTEEALRAAWGQRRGLQLQRRRVSAG